MRTEEEIVSALTAEKERLEKKLKEMREFHAAAWREYGSELCGGEMQGDEKKLADRASRIGEFLRIYAGSDSRRLAGTHDRVLFQKELARKDISRLQEKMKYLETEEKLLEEMATIAGVDLKEKK